jgi:hypothetical protein
VTETGGKQFSIGVENELRKNQLFREVMETSEEDLTKRSKKKYFIRIA